MCSKFSVRLTLIFSFRRISHPHPNTNQDHNQNQTRQRLRTMLKKIPEITLKKTFEGYYSERKVYIINHLADGLLKELFFSDNTPKHEINLS